MAAGCTEAGACRAAAVSRSSFRYVSCRRDKTELILAIKALRERERRSRCERVGGRLRTSGHAVKRKKLEHPWRELGLAKPLRRLKKKRRSGEMAPVSAERINNAWTLGRLQPDAKSAT